MRMKKDSEEILGARVHQLLLGLSFLSNPPLTIKSISYFSLNQYINARESIASQHHRSLEAPLCSSGGQSTAVLFD